MSVTAARIGSFNLINRAKLAHSFGMSRTTYEIVDWLAVGVFGGSRDSRRS
jgi:hypothetical protein